MKKLMKFIIKICHFLKLLITILVFFFVLSLLIKFNDITINLLKIYVYDINFVPLYKIYDNIFILKHINTLYILFYETYYCSFGDIIESTIENINNKIYCSIYNMASHQDNYRNCIDDSWNNGVSKIEGSQDSSCKSCENTEQSSDNENNQNKPKLDKGKGKAIDTSREDLEKKATEVLEQEKRQAQIKQDEKFVLELLEEERITRMKEELDFYSTENKSDFLKNKTSSDFHCYTEYAEKTETEFTPEPEPESESDSSYDSEKFATNTINSNDDESTVQEKLRLQELDIKLKQEKIDRDLAMDLQNSETDNCLEGFIPEEHSENRNADEKPSKISVKRKRSFDDNDVWEESSKTGSNRKSGGKKR